MLLYLNICLYQFFNFLIGLFYFKRIYLFYMEFLFDQQINTNKNELKLINNYFQLPIMFIDNKLELPPNINGDLELYSETENTSGENDKLYEYTFNPSNPYAKHIIKEWGKYYTHDTKFLKDTQTLIKGLSSQKNTNILSCWDTIKQDNNFKDKYHYIEFKYFNKFNESSTFLQLLSMYNMSSPIFSLIIPILMLILPFFILKLQGISLTITKYFEVLKQVFSNHTLGKIFTDFRNISWSKRFYIVFSIGFYIFQIYQNILTCIRFHRNLQLIITYFDEIKLYLDCTIERYNLFLSQSESLSTYSEFNKNLIYHKNIFIDFRNNLDNMPDNSFQSYLRVGYIMKWFYIFFYNKNINDSFMYSFGFNGYMDNILGLTQNIQNKKIQFCKFNNKNKVSFKNAYYAPLMDKNPVKNSYSVNKNISITGPNAAGKTTILKTTLFNIILSQQIGCGFYSSANINPYHYLHCYLNIPDTSGRDSLFQAEARRCKEIIQCIDNSDNNHRHFCIFDELYSGTNPYEAVASAHSFIKYLKTKNVNFILTTHFINLCESIERNELCENYKMDINILENKEFIYKYKLTSGISNIKGGVKVLRDLEYPENIITDTEKYLENN